MESLMNKTNNTIGLYMWTIYMAPDQIEIILYATVYNIMLCYPPITK